jgi:hypothetical protein
MVSSMMKIEVNEAVDGPVDSEGGCSPSALSMGQAQPQPMTAPAIAAAQGAASAKVGPLAPGQR